MRWELLLGCNLIIVLHSLLPISHFRVRNFVGFFGDNVGNTEACFQLAGFFPHFSFLGTFLASSSLSPGSGEFQPPPAGTETRGLRVLL